MFKINNNLEKIILSYRNLKSWYRLYGRIYDRFGYWNKALHRLPQYTDLSIEKCTMARVKQLGYKTIMWSGGVDSTFIICAYIKASIPFNIIYDLNSIIDGTAFYEWLCKNQSKYKYNMKCLRDIRFAYKFPNLLSGDVADLLFSPDEARRTILNPNIDFKTNLYKLYPNEADTLWTDIQNYSKLLNKPIDTNKHIIRLLNFGCFYLHTRDELNFYIFPNIKICAFFDTDLFNDIAYSQYWDRDVLDNKPEMHKFICNITQDDSFMTKVYRTPTSVNLVEPRHKLNEESYKLYDY